jgi:hypothetical protein
MVRIIAAILLASVTTGQMFGGGRDRPESLPGQKNVHGAPPGGFGAKKYGLGGNMPGMGGMGMGGMPPGMMGGGGGGGGMPPGMMGGGGGGGMPPGRPPPIKDVSLKDARRCLKELINALKPDSSRKTITAALQRAANNPQASEIKDAKQAAEYRMQALMPALHQITGSVCNKYGFQGGFLEAMASISKHADDDEKIAADVGPLRALITGQNPQANQGKIKEFDRLAFLFTKAKDDLKPFVIEDTEKELKNTTDPIAPYYLKVMNKVLKKGHGFIETEAKRLISLMQNAGTAQEKRLKFSKQVNILSSFLTKEDMERMGKEAEDKRMAQVVL